ncbi:MAG: thiamine-phosphate kinase [Candidatus Omnitrophota bacterium]|nr:thiamine-phosphate kinase [Candidatus Omnitrophota bacterium]
MKIRDIGEIGLIRRFAAKQRVDKSVIQASGDDAAVIRWTKTKYLLLTCDMLIEDVHFKLRRALPYQIGWKALARTISDIAAMGGVPRYALVSIGISPKAPVSLADGIHQGMVSLAKRFKVNIVGGDLARSEKLVIDVSLAGECEKKNLVLRSGARPGDIIFVTGAIGGSIRGKHLDFTPRVAEARRIVNNFKINSMIDISDALLLDLWRISDASAVGARIYESLIPLSRDAGSFVKAVSQGEDFELLFTMSRIEAKRLLKAAPVLMKTPVTAIGEITAAQDPRCRLVKKDGTEEAFGPNGYLHF